LFHELGLQILFSKVAMKPGKPTVFARKGDKLIFGLPGNPVSTFMAFESFVRPALGAYVRAYQTRAPSHSRLPASGYEAKARQDRFSSGLGDLGPGPMENRAAPVERIRGHHRILPGECNGDISGRSR